MKNLILFILFAGIFCSFYGCSDDATITNNAEKIVGKWVATEINGEPALTDSLFSIEFLSDNIEVYSSGITIDSNNSKWTQSSNYTYRIANDSIIINGFDYFNKPITAIFKIHNLSNSVLKYSVISFICDGILMPDTKIYTCERRTEDYSAEIIGMWYGKCTSANSSDTLYHYWEYQTDGKYNYYFQDQEGSWIKKSDNEGGYFLYGDLFASNYINDLNTGALGYRYECWSISIANNKMKWIGKRLDKVVSYEMDKVEKIPTL